MKNNRFIILLALLQMAGGLTMQAQEYPQDLEVIYRSDSVYVITVKSIDENTFLAFGGTHAGSRTIMKMTYDGEILDSIGLPTNRLQFWKYGDFINGKFRYVSFGMEENDTLPLLCVVDVDLEDLSLTYTGYDWEGLDFNHPQVEAFYTNMIYTIFRNDGSMLLSYPVDSLWMINQKEAMHLIKFDCQGNVVKEKILNDLPASITNHFFSTPDSLGCRIILRNPNHYTFDCHTLDEDFNTVSVVEEAGIVYCSYPHVLNWPYYCIGETPTIIRLNPYNGQSYSINSDSPFEEEKKTNGSEKSKMDVLMGVYDKDFNQLDWTWGLTNPRGNDEGFGMCFGANGEIYMLGYMDIRTNVKPENMYVGLLDEDLNKLSEIYYIPQDYYIGPLDIADCPTGGCIVCSNRLKISTDQADYCIFRITPEDFLNVEEAHSHGFAVATAFPNPGTSTLNIRTALQKARVEVYDTNGRLIHSQAITENVTGIDAGDWAEGIYVWKVISNGKEAETGKWIKQ
ncbi:MAG: T9SS type A sorting domain-containing protein [Bacteroidales bacterium]|nr:T9SS type A sorting domain-containing protein [Bacteroidales bacterium]